MMFYLVGFRQEIDSRLTVCHAWRGQHLTCSVKKTSHIPAQSGVGAADVNNRGIRVSPRAARQAVRTLTRHQLISTFPVLSEQETPAQSGGSPSSAVSAVAGSGSAPGECPVGCCPECLPPRSWGGEVGWIYFGDIHLPT